MREETCEVGRRKRRGDGQYVPDVERGIERFEL